MTLSKQHIQFVRSLQLKKFRQKYNNFVVEGDKMVREILQQQHIRMASLYALPEWLDANALLLTYCNVPMHPISPAELHKISGLSTPNQVLAVADIPEPPTITSLALEGFSLYLDQIQDPGNLGTLLRIADWFGLRYVFCSPGCVDVYNPKVVQASMGAILRVPCLERNLPELTAAFPTLPICGAVLDGDNLFRTTLPQHGLIVIGNESRGIAEDTAALLTNRLTIPAPQHAGAESLNAAVAAGIIIAVLIDRA
ncbi:MAG TPA: RNA methyltransferase [Saprospiraceae bacterium]|nr:RNA methyltransferase [Saprospiraceae bacterium]HMP12838.1 RNA methyltransferase [Saprospiraceae bacterium]